MVAEGRRGGRGDRAGQLLEVGEVEETGLGR